MRLATPRLEPLPEEAIDPELRERLGPGPMLHIFRTLAHHPKLLKRWMVFGNHVLAKSELPPRERELVILRTGHLCRCGYEWGQHVRIAREAGLDDATIARVAEGPEAPGWEEGERLLLRAADELHADAFVTDATWRGLAQRWPTKALLDLLFTVGQYRLVAMALNTLGVQPESADFPRLPASR